MRRKTRITAVAVGVMVLVAMAACGGSDSSTRKKAPQSNTTTCSAKSGGGPAVDAIKKKGKLTVGVKFDQPLFGQQNPGNNKIEGFDAEIARRVACAIFGPNNIKSHVDFVSTPSKVRETSIQDSKVDIVVATYTINDERKKLVDFAGPYYVAGQDILVKKSDSSIKGVADLNGKKVCSATGSTSIKNLTQKAPQADTSITFDGYSDCVNALLDGRVQAVTTDNSILLGFVSQHPNDLKIVNKPFTDEPYGIGLKKGDTQFRNYLNDVIEQSYKDGTWTKAWTTQVEPSTGQKPPQQPKVNRY